MFSAFRESGAGSELAFDVLLHELALEAGSVISTSSSAIALRDSENQFVCRAVAGDFAPRVGTRIESHDGLSAACIRSGQIQVCQDTDADSRVDTEICRALGMRSFVILPLFLEQALVGVLEVFAPNPGALDRALLERLGGVGDRIVQTVAFASERPDQRLPAPERTQPAVRPWVEATLPERPPAVAMVAAALPQTSSLNRTRVDDPMPSPPVAAIAFPEPGFVHPPARSRRNLGLALAALATGLVAATALWWLPSDASLPSSDRNAPQQSLSAGDPSVAAAATSVNLTARPSPGRTAKPSAAIKAAPSAPRDKQPSGNATEAHSGGLVVYEKGKVVYRGTPENGELVGPVTSAAETEKLQDTADVATPLPGQAPGAAITGGKLIHQVAPVLPAEVADLHVPDEVLLEGIVGRDGTVRDIRFIRGDARLFGAAIDAVRQWRYEPFRSNGEPVDMLATLSVRFQ